ncbi:GWxTD domain-containing protein [candidate division KSB1 bacterium]|nr:MAG: GWxTD domain-containing protein [candidate division KSB1 bacterium]
MWKIILIGLFTAVNIAYSAPRGLHVPNLLSEGEGPVFRCQLGQRLGIETDSLHVVTAISIPYDNLIFLRSDSGFAAQYELVTSLFREGTGLYSERIAAQSATTPSYAETNSRTRNAAHMEEFLVPPGDYRVRVTLTADKESRKKSRWEGTISLAPSDPLLRVSDIYWVTEDVALAELGVPRLVEGFSTTEGDAHARMQLFSAGSQPIRLVWTVLGEKSDTLRSSIMTALPTADIQTHEFVMKIEGLPVQHYTLRLEAEGNGRREIRTRQFHIRIPGVPLSVTDFDTAIRQMKYIATGEENRALRQADPRDRERVFKEFWKKRDPSPDTDENELMEEYFRRVEYANEKFATHREGWDTDRGRIYLVYGEPTDIERHPFEPDSRPYEIWYYTQIARRFVFVDYTGFGDYTLVGPEWGY